MSMSSLLLCAALSGPVALAQTSVDIELDPEAAAALGLDADEAQAALELLVDEELERLDTAGFLGSIAEAAGVVGKGMGVDYASRPEAFVVGVSAGLAPARGFEATVGEDTFSWRGPIVLASFMGGINLGVFEPGGEPGWLDRFVVSANGVAFQATCRGVEASVGAAGGHLSFAALRPRQDGLLRWGGLVVTSGYEYTVYRLSYAGDVGLTTRVSGGSLTWEGTGAGSLGVTDHSVPLEVSTHGSLAMFTVFAGGALDLHAGQGVALASLAGPVFGSSSGKTQKVGSLAVQLRDDGRARPIAARLFGGAQIELLPLKFYLQANLDSTGGTSMHAGMRVVR